MKRKISGIAVLLFATAVISSCNGKPEETYNPFDEPKKGEFYPSSVTIDKTTENTSECESWTDIVKDSEDRIVEYVYDYKYETGDGDTKNEKRKCKIYYFKNHAGNDVITTHTNIEYSQQQKGIKKEYTRTQTENITLNSNGHINKIATTIAHFENGAEEPVMKTSERTFTYEKSFCISSTYVDESSKTTYTYDWNAYQLTGITTLKEIYTDGIVEHDKCVYTYDNDRLYSYSGAELMPFVQRGLPEIFASMGYFGKCTPYILLEENHSGRTKYNSSNTTINTEVTNKFTFNGDADSKIRYSALSNIYRTYDIVFNK